MTENFWQSHVSLAEAWGLPHWDMQIGFLVDGRQTGSNRRLLYAEGFACGRGIALCSNGRSHGAVREAGARIGDDDEPLRDNELAEKTGIVHFSNAGCNFQTGSKRLETRPIRSCCAKTVLADNRSVACSLVVDLADQAVCGLNFKPFQSMFPELGSVARKHHLPA